MRPVLHTSILFMHSVVSYSGDYFSLQEAFGQIKFVSLTEMLVLRLLCHLVVMGLLVKV